jgi:hypothetical protein
MRWRDEWSLLCHGEADPEMSTIRAFPTSLHRSIVSHVQLNTTFLCCIVDVHKRSLTLSIGFSNSQSTNASITEFIHIDFNLMTHGMILEKLQQHMRCSFGHFELDTILYHSAYN